jgi:hypothetical protein
MARGALGRHCRNSVGTVAPACIPIPCCSLCLRVSVVGFVLPITRDVSFHGDYGNFLCSWGYMNTLPLPCSPFLKDLHDSSPGVPIRPCCKQSPCLNPPHLIPILAERSGRGSQAIKHKTQRKFRCAAVQSFITRGPQPPSAAIFLLSQLRTPCFLKSSGTLIIKSITNA